MWSRSVVKQLAQILSLQMGVWLKSTSAVIRTLLALGEIYDNENVLIEGVAELVHGVEIPNRTVVDVSAMVGLRELASLELLLLSDSSFAASTVLPYFEDILNF